MRIKTNHINYATFDGRVYCYKQSKIVNLNKKQWKVCNKCKYLNGSAQGEGVECLYYDTSNKEVVQFGDANEAELYAAKWKRKLKADISFEKEELKMNEVKEADRL